jgi:hypothetical protein
MGVRRWLKVTLWVLLTPITLLGVGLGIREIVSHIPFPTEMLQIEDAAITRPEAGSRGRISGLSDFSATVTNRASYPVTSVRIRIDVADANGNPYDGVEILLYMGIPGNSTRQIVSKFLSDNLSTPEGSSWEMKVLGAKRYR